MDWEVLALSSANKSAVNIDCDWEQSWMGWQGWRVVFF